MRVSRGPLNGRNPVLKSPAEQVKYYLVCEGKDTERIYFETLERCREELGVHPRTGLVLLVRGYSEYRLTNPKSLLETVLKYKDESDRGVISYRLLIDWILDSIMERKGLVSPDKWTKGIRISLYTVARKRMGVALEDTFSLTEAKAVCEKFSENLSQYEKDGWTEIVRDIPDMIEPVFAAYDPSKDKICLIVDRDKESFTDEQYKDVLNRCRETENMDFYPSNPCFEFWLLMHYDEVLKLDRNQLKENPKSGDGKKSPRYAEIEMRKLMPDYTKSAYDAQSLMKRIDRAVENERAFCEDADNLRFEIGSRVGILIRALRGQ